MTDTPNPYGGSSTDPSSAPDASSSKAETLGKAIGGRRRAERPKSVVRRHWLLLSFALVLALIAGTTGSYLWYLNHQLGNIDRVDAGITEDPWQGHESDKPLNILLLGADNGDGQTESVAADMADGKWTPFE